ncbi:MAG TPA: hypothetical protein VGH99_12720 [Pseudonocardia sp.]|jgi:hypothetical protein
MSHPQHQFRAFIDDGPHAGETLSLSPDDDGQAPKRIVLADPAHRPGLGDRTENSPGQRESGGSTAYELQDTDLDAGLWIYRRTGR